MKNDETNFSSDESDESDKKSTENVLMAKRNTVKVDWTKNYYYYGMKKRRYVKRKIKLQNPQIAERKKSKPKIITEKVKNEIDNILDTVTTLTSSSPSKNKKADQPSCSSAESIINLSDEELEEKYEDNNKQMSFKNNLSNWKGKKRFQKQEICQICQRVKCIYDHNIKVPYKPKGYHYEKRKKIDVKNIITSSMPRKRSSPEKYNCKDYVSWKPRSYARRSFVYSNSYDDDSTNNSERNISPEANLVMNSEIKKEILKSDEPVQETDNSWNWKEVFKNKVKLEESENDQENINNNENCFELNKNVHYEKCDENCTSEAKSSANSTEGSTVSDKHIAKAYCTDLSFFDKINSSYSEENYSYLSSETKSALPLEPASKMSPFASENFLSALHILSPMGALVRKYIKPRNALCKVDGGKFSQTTTKAQKTELTNREWYCKRKQLLKRLKLNSNNKPNAKKNKYKGINHTVVSPPSVEHDYSHSVTKWHCQGENCETELLPDELKLQTCNLDEVVPVEETSPCFVVQFHHIRPGCFEELNWSDISEFFSSTDSKCSNTSTDMGEFPVLTSISPFDELQQESADLVVEETVVHFNSVKNWDPQNFGDEGEAENRTILIEDPPISSISKFQKNCKNFDCTNSLYHAPTTEARCADDEEEDDQISAESAQGSSFTLNFNNYVETCGSPIKQKRGRLGKSSNPLNQQSDYKFLHLLPKSHLVPSAKFNRFLSATPNVKRRGPGRPRKTNKFTYWKMEQVKNKIVSDVDVQFINPEEESLQSVNRADNSIRSLCTVKRGPGRPRKVTKKTSETFASLCAVKRGRGRPRKVCNITEESHSKNVLEPDSSVDCKISVNPINSRSVPMVKRGRGRPRKI